MAKVLGVGGVFFKCKDKVSLGQWYETHLGFTLNEYGGLEFQFDAAPPGGYCVWGPFSDDTDYFSPSTRDFMINLMVDDVEAVLARAQAGGAQIIGEIDNCEFGRFGWFMDPEGNKIELWQPDPDYKRSK